MPPGSQWKRLPRRARNGPDVDRGNVHQQKLAADEHRLPVLKLDGAAREAVSESFMGIRSLLVGVHSPDSGRPGTVDGFAFIDHLMISTGTCERASTLAATLPSTILASPLRPCEPITMRSAPHDNAASTMPLAAW